MNALVLGGSGHLGRAVVAELARQGAKVAFVHRPGEVDLPGGRALAADLRGPQAIPDVFADLEAEGALPQAVIHCAGAAPALALSEITFNEHLELQALHAGAALACAQEMAKRELKGHLLLVAALDGLAPVPAPAHYAASQGALWGLGRALAKELGPKGLRVNLAVVGVLEGGISSALDPGLRDSYSRHAALGRTGTGEETAKALVRLALRDPYLNGARVDLTGGLG